MQQNKATSDGDLIRSYLEGNPDSLKLLIEKWHVHFCNKAFWIVKNADLSKDIAQDSWQVILNKLVELKHPDKFQFWASRIVYNKSIDALNKANKELLELKSFKYSNSILDTDSSDNEKLNIQLLKAIKTLPINHQQVLHLFYLEQYSIVDVAKKLNISKGTAKSRLFYAREKLKNYLKGKYY